MKQPVILSFLCIMLLYGTALYAAYTTEGEDIAVENQSQQLEDKRLEEQRLEQQRQDQQRQDQRLEQRRLEQRRLQQQQQRKTIADATPHPN